MACAAVGLSRATLYRDRRPQMPPVPRERPVPLRALSPVEQGVVLSVLHSERFVDQTPAEVYAKLLDEGRYLCSVRTMYRLLAANGEVKERRNVRRHPVYQKPVLVARKPNEVWSWDITKLPGPSKGMHYCLYVVLDIFSRYVVGWMVAERESAELAQLLLAECCRKQEIRPGQLTIHADRGSPMIARPVTLKLGELGVVKSHSRPRVSNDNPFSEAQFKTLKYQPTFPDAFGSPEDARVHCRELLEWYNSEHHHSSLALCTPEEVHYGRAAGILATRGQTLLAAYAEHPERFVRRAPQPGQLPQEVWINPPEHLVEVGGPGQFPLAQPPAPPRAPRDAGPLRWSRMPSVEVRTAVAAVPPRKPFYPLTEEPPDSE